MTLYADIADYEEDNRIDIIGKVVMQQNMTSAFVVEKDGKKADRYIAKLQAKFPGIRVMERGNGPVAGTEFVKVGPPIH